MNRETVLGIVVALLVGLLGGYLVFNVASKKQEAAAPAAGALPMGAGSPQDYQTRIAEAQKIVARDPRNAQAWVQLGNDYFDTEQSQKAIEAYGKALEIQPNNPDVLTDQGVMFRRVGWYDRAIANFEKANAVDPKHLQSLFNLGVVYSEDLKQPAKAIEAFNRFLAIDSTSPNAQQVKAQVDRLKGMSQGK